MLPGDTTSKLLPSESICFLTSSWAPWPRPTVSITDETPMMMPSIVRTDRNRWACTASNPVRNVSGQFISLPPA